MPRSVDLINLVKIDLLKGRSNADLNSLSRILRDNYDNRLLDDVTTSSYEDSYCPPNDIIDGVIREMKNDFYAATKEEIEVEIIDLRTLLPFDAAMFARTVPKLPPPKTATLKTLLIIKISTYPVALNILQDLEVNHLLQ
mgnify:CR=1 FL=1